MVDSMNDPVELPTQQGYDLWSSLYDDEDNPLVGLEQVQFERVMADACGLRVLDAGCGTGRHALWLSRSGAHVTAIDFSAGMLEKARAKPGAQSVEFLQHDLHTPLPFAERKFDRVVSGLVVDHIINLVDYFTELRRVCRRGGFLLITVMHPALYLQGVQARFTDPETGALVLPASRQHLVSDYVMAALTAGLSIRQMREYRVDDELIAGSHRAQRYLGWPMLLLFVLSP
ncbi:MAG: class I SAM-dependent methyltransferase [Planctomycetaceae bacterium]|nr:class I SAM-dependent methyltransferase [Planctomycetaceae bacterium]